MEETPHAKHSTPRRLYLLTYPRTASHLLTRILALADQPSLSLATNADGTTKEGYFFLRVMGERDARRLWDRDVREWSVEDRRAMKDAYDACARSLRDYAEAAGREGRTAFVKEHVGFVREPVGMSRVLRAGRRRQDGSNEGVDHVDLDVDDEPPWTANLDPEQKTTTTHSPLNETIFPDQFLHTWSPIFLIRHPALAFPSLYRTINDLDRIDPGSRYTTVQLTQEMYLHSTRTFHDFYAGHFGARSDWPVVVDADDVMKSPEVVRKLCEVVGLDGTKLRFTWAAATVGEVAGMGVGERRMLDCLSASTGVVAAKAGGAVDVDVEVEVERWKGEFGEVVAAKLERWVKGAMDDYEYLRRRRLTV